MLKKLTVCDLFLICVALCLGHLADTHQRSHWVVHARGAADAS